MLNNSPSLIVVYASQEGNTQAIAEDLVEECSSLGIVASLSCISKLEKDPGLLQRQDCAIFIASTTGDGDPPDTARKWWRFINKAYDAKLKKIDNQTLSQGGDQSSPVQENKARIHSGEQSPAEDIVSKADQINESKTAIPSKAQEKDHILTNESNPSTTFRSKEGKSEKPVDTPESSSKLPFKPQEDKFADNYSPQESRSGDNCKPDDKKSDALRGYDNKTSLSIKSICGKSLQSNIQSQNLSELTYSVLGLGDTNYTNFCNFGKNLDEKLHKLGAKRFYPCGWADDGTGLEIVIEPWLEGLWGVLRLHLDSVAKRIRSTGDSVNYMGSVAKGKQIGGRQCDQNTDVNREILDEVDSVNGSGGVHVPLEEVRDTVLVINSLNYSVQTDSCSIVKSVLSSEIMDGESTNSSGSGANGEKEKDSCESVVATNNTKSLNINSILVNQNASKPGSEKRVPPSNIAFNGVDNLPIASNVLINTVDTTDSFSNSVESNSTDILDKLQRFNLSEDSNPPKCISEWRKNHILYQLALPLDAKLTIPKLPSYGNILLSFDENNCSACNNSYQNGAPLPSAETATFVGDIVQFKQLTNSMQGKDVKRTMELVVQLPSNSEHLVQYQPGDSIAVLVKNNPKEVQSILEMLQVGNPNEVLTLSRSTSARKLFPAHLPLRTTHTEIFSSCVDFKCVPKKAMLLHLLDCATDTHEKRCLQELVCREGAEFYRTKILENLLTFFDVLTVFTSCKPSVATLLELLPRLLPRAYSLTSSPLQEKNRISFAYNLVTIPESSHIRIRRYGICSGILNNAYEKYLEVPSYCYKLSLYFRNSKSFRLPEDPSKPIILVGPGTGVAPLVGFLRHRQMQVTTAQLSLEQLGQSWLFFGCRYSGADEIYKEELGALQQSGVLTNLHCCFSRDLTTVTSAPRPRYVQDLIAAEGATLATAIAEGDARVYVCGDAANMAQQVLAAFVNVMSKHFGDEQQGLNFVTNMQKSKKYRQDVWT